MMLRRTIVSAVVCTMPLAAGAQMGNPAGMGVDTRMARPGIPAPHQTNNRTDYSRSLLPLAASRRWNWESSLAQRRRKTPSAVLPR